MSWSRSAGFVFAATIATTACGGSGSRTVPTSPGSAALSAPTVESPINDAQLDTLRPTFVVKNATSKESGAKTYEFQIATVDDFTSTLITQAAIAEGGSGTTSFTPPADLPASTRIFWRARALQAGALSAWSTVAQARTKAGGFNRAGELFDPLNNGQTIGERVGSTTFVGTTGLRVDNANSWVKYQLAETITTGEISVEVTGLAPNNPGGKSRIFSMADGDTVLFNSLYLFNAQYRGVAGNPDNAISFKVLMGNAGLKYEPDLAQRAAAVRAFNPNTTYLWTATWGPAFRLTVREGGVSGPVVYDIVMPTAGTYNPTPHAVYLGANDAAFESGSYPGAIYRNLWVGRGPRPATLGSTR